MIKKCLGLEGDLDDAGIGYEPSPFAKRIGIVKKTDYKVVEFDKQYKGDKKILMICTEERYMLMANGKKFSSGNHPVESCHPIMHLVNAGFDYDVATPTGKPVCLEMWALPQKDEVFLDFFNKTAKPKFDAPFSLADIVTDEKKLSQYLCFFPPGGHGAMLGLPEDENLGKLLGYAKEKDLFIMSLCHGPAAFLAAAKQEPFPFDGYKIACYPDSVDKQAPMIGYVPGELTWYCGEKLIALGVTIVNKAADATVVEDRKLITGASPKACQGLGVLVAKKLLESYA
eukprot:CAMPEP_0113629678 /NCGR_PEP_ID=MMETSP0017_2-20120614/15410_1 /TAXON_ID=2856 /ORGANISM="Cylindrotheca closterium" /LENGTH=284 /DNA_ID=CAMNT_0000540093 /DNA_START=84 /DNA_END=941 /DNA_ORIENTATION=- /assembly_acc=CAM_ASM_000147